MQQFCFPGPCLSFLLPICCICYLFNHFFHFIIFFLYLCTFFFFFKCQISPWFQASPETRTPLCLECPLCTNGKYIFFFFFSANQFHIQTAALTATRHFLLTNDKCHHCCCCCESTILADQWGAAPLLLRYCCNMNFNKTCLTGPWRIRLQKVKACPLEHGTDGQMLFLTNTAVHLFKLLDNTRLEKCMSHFKHSGSDPQSDCPA